MGKKFLYRIFDNKTGVWLPEEYTNVEVCELFGLPENTSVSQYAKRDCLFRGRYAIEVVGNVKVPDAWAVEWDSARLKLLGTGRGCELEEQIIVNAVRYALSRESYVVSMTCEFVSGVSRRLSSRCVSLLIREITQEMERERTACDEEDWKRLLGVLRSRVHV